MGKEGLSGRQTDQQGMMVPLSLILPLTKFKGFFSRRDSPHSLLIIHVPWWCY